MREWLLRMSVACSLALAAGAVTTGCGGSDDDDDDAPPAEEEATMTGTWNASYSTGVDFTLALTQEGDAFSGDYETEGGVQGTVAGTVSGNAVTMTITTEGGVVAEFDGSVNDARTSMGGDFTIVAGGGGNGTWSASK